MSVSGRLRGDGKMVSSRRRLNWRKGRGAASRRPRAWRRRPPRHTGLAIKKAWDSDEFKEFMNRRGFDMIYVDRAKFGEFMKADDASDGAPLKALGLAK